MRTETYNGWTNYETWNVKLWMDNEYDQYCYWQEQAKAAICENTDDKQAAVRDLENHLSESIQADKPDIKGCYADLLNAALSDVNWREIAQNLIDEIDD